MTTLYKLNEQYQEIFYKLLLEEENNEDLIEELALIEIEIEDKAENTAIVLKELEANINKFKEEEKRLYERRKALENNVKYLKSNLEYTMKLQGKNKFKTDHFSFSIQKNAPSVLITNEALIPEDYQKVKVEIDKTKLKNDLKEGLIIEGAELHQSESLRIR